MRARFARRAKHRFSTFGHELGHAYALDSVYNTSFIKF